MIHNPKAIRDHVHSCSLLEGSLVLVEVKVEKSGALFLDVSMEVIWPRKYV